MHKNAPIWLKIEIWLYRGLMRGCSENHSNQKIYFHVIAFIVIFYHRVWPYGKKNWKKVSRDFYTNRSAKNCWKLFRKRHVPITNIKPVGAMKRFTQFKLLLERVSVNHTCLTRLFHFVVFCVWESLTWSKKLPNKLFIWNSHFAL